MFDRETVEAMCFDRFFVLAAKIGTKGDRMKSLHNAYDSAKLCQEHLCKNDSNALRYEAAQDCRIYDKLVRCGDEAHPADRGPLPSVFSYEGIMDTVDADEYDSNGVILNEPAQGEISVAAGFPNLSERDIALLHQIEIGLPLVADVSRADVLICCLLTHRQIRIFSHASPHSISSLYRQPAEGRTFSADDQPLIYRTVSDGGGGRYRKHVITDGAPVTQEALPIYNAAHRVIAALVIETNMIEHERHKRRNNHFRRGLRWLHRMAARGELEIGQELSRFGPFDGIYMVDADRQVLYLSGIAANMFRSIGLVKDLRRHHVSALEKVDEELVEQSLSAQRCLEMRHESEDGRLWARKVIPLRAPPQSWQRIRRRIPLSRTPSKNNSLEMDAALVLVHNATEAVQKQRELNVKSAMIQELHHRVKNNLQTIAALLRLQSRRSKSEEAQQYLTDAVNRVLSMSVIHEFLSQDGNHPINIRDVCKRIAVQVQQVTSEPGQVIAIEVSGPSIRLPASQATATALVVNELLLNAMEHGIRDRNDGRITIELSDLGNQAQVIIQDNGAGLPADFDVAQSSSLGLQIIRTLVIDDLKGQLRIEPVLATDPVPASAQGTTFPVEEAATISGTRAIIRFPKRSLADS